MLTRRNVVAMVASTALLVRPGPTEAQTLDELIETGRFEDAVSMVANASPEEAREAARLIFNAAYRMGHQQQDYDFAIRGFTAAKRLVDLGEALYEQLSFWHGFSVYSAAVEAQLPQTIATAEIALPMFEEARDLFTSVGTYPSTINVNMAQLLDATDTYIEIQQTVIRRGRQAGPG